MKIRRTCNILLMYWIVLGTVFFNGGVQRHDLADNVFSLKLA